MKPFSLQLWMAILAASTLTSLVFFVMDYWSGDDKRFTAKVTVPYFFFSAIFSFTYLMRRC